MSRSFYLVTPCRNATATIDATIWSVVSQAPSQASGLNLHYHVQDGASTDGTADKLAAWAERMERMAGDLPARVFFSYDSRPDAGMYDALSKGVSALNIPPEAFMGWLNGDDVLWPGAAEAIARMSDALPTVDWIVGAPTWVSPTGRLNAIDWQAYHPQVLLAEGAADGCHWPFLQQESTFWRKRLWDKAGGVNPNFRLAGDWDLWRRFAGFSPLVHVSRQLGSFCVRPGQLSSDIESYRAEMNAVRSQAERRAAFVRLARQSGLARVPTAAEDQGGIWRQGERTSHTRRSRLAHGVFRRLPALALRTKLLQELWKS